MAVLSERESPDPAVVRRYYLLRSLAALSALTFALVLAVRDGLYVSDVERPIDGIAAWLTRLGYEWLGKVVGGMADSYFEQGQVLLTMILVVYGLAQIAGAAADRRAMAGSAFGLGRGTRAVLALLTARAFPVEQNRKMDFALHFVQGRELLFAPLRFGLWLLPVLGFLGTIIGVSAAIEKLPAAMQGQGAQLAGVINELHFAFDTTFIGLVGAIALMVITVSVASLWERNDAVYRASLDRTTA